MCLNILNNWRVLILVNLFGGGVDHGDERHGD
jgi:hypothetical protein